MTYREKHYIKYIFMLFDAFYFQSATLCSQSYEYTGALFDAIVIYDK